MLTEKRPRQLIMMMRDEGVFLIEWLAHHLVVGFTDILISTNNCTDGSDALTKALAAHGVCRHLPMILAANERPQPATYKAIKNAQLLNPNAPAMVLDSDEFLNIHIAPHTVDALIEKMGNFHLMTVFWRSFGASGHENWQPGPVTENFLYGPPVNHGTNRLTKTLMRQAGDFSKLAPHFPKGFLGEWPLLVMDSNGSSIPFPKGSDTRAFKHFLSLKIKTPAHKLAQVNHYATKTLDSFMMRKKRGRAWNDNPRHTEEYFINFNSHAVLDDSILRYKYARRKKENEIRSLPGIAEMEANVIQKYQEALAMMMKTDGG